MDRPAARRGNARSIAFASFSTAWVPDAVSSRAWKPSSKPTLDVSAAAEKGQTYSCFAEFRTRRPLMRSGGDPNRVGTPICSTGNRRTPSSVLVTGSSYLSVLERSGRRPERGSLRARVHERAPCAIGCSTPGPTSRTATPRPPSAPAFDAERRSTMRFGPECGPVDSPLNEERHAWDGITA